jgi:hypothetical protein
MLSALGISVASKPIIALAFPPVLFIQKMPPFAAGLLKKKENH